MYIVFVDEFDGVHEVCVDDPATFLIKVKFLDALECQSGRKGPVSDE